MKQLVLLSISLLLSVSCTTREKVVKEEFPDGSPKLVEVYTYEGDEKKLVKQIAYYDNEHKRVEGEFKKGEKHGKWTYWYESGTIWSQGFFKEGLGHGKRTIWHENGNKYIEGEYYQGKRTGEWKFWNENGELLKTKNYGKPHKEELS